MCLTTIALRYMWLQTKHMPQHFAKFFGRNPNNSHTYFVNLNHKPNNLFLLQIMKSHTCGGCLILVRQIVAGNQTSPT